MSKLFQKDDLNKIISESEAAKASGSGKKAVVPGKHLLTLTEVNITNSKSDNNPMVKIVANADADHRDLMSHFKLQGSGSEVGRKMVVDFFFRSFGYKVQECDTAADLLKQLIKFKGKTFSAIVNGQQEAYCFKDKQNRDVVMEVTKSDIWYTGTTAEFDELNYDAAKLIKPLSDQHKEQLTKFAQINGGPYDPKSAAKSATTSTSQSANLSNPIVAPVASVPIMDIGSDDDMPF
jgi:hypothetical protein